ncbi:DUF3592 domain-containing protein [Streptomyces sp. NPDC059002]|uniref:DUF3592 domain-containing protein n=1 Tax=Streptomyces sp. NPDC059002 TaxID=3346690 RepID=UPI0036B102B5
MGRIPDVVLRGRGVVFRLTANAVLVVRGRVTWTVPLAAIGRVACAGGRVRLELSGGGEDDAVALTTRNVTAADAFTQRLRSALGRVSTVDHGPSLVTVQTAERRRPRLPGRPLLWLIGPAVVAYFAFFEVALERGAEAGIGGLVGFIMLYGPVGWLMFAVGWKEVVRDALILWRRGITVSGRIRDYKSHGGSASSDTEWRPIYEFRTLEGEHLVVTQPVGYAHKGRTGPVDVTYDPLSPTRVRSARDRRLAARGTVLTFFGVLSFALLLIPLWLVVAGLLPG